MLKKFLHVAPALLAITVATPLFAAPDEFEYEFDEPEPWKETVKAMPDYPQEKNLVPVDVQKVNTSFKFFIDSKSVSTSDDNVVTYTVVIRSDSGAENVLHEGLRCGFEEYKLYAYGTSDASFYINKAPQWQNIPRNGTNAYRSELVDYMCDTNLLPLKPKQILDRIRYPGNIPKLSD